MGTVAGPVTPMATGDGGFFGQWVHNDDSPALPRFVVDTGKTSVGLILPDGGLPAIWHQIGNAGLTATAHAGGWIELWSTARGMARMTGTANHGGIVGRPRSIRRVTWRMGGAEWHDADDHYSIVRRVTCSRSREPVARIDVTITRCDARAAPALIYQEHWPAEPDHLLIGTLMSPWIPAPIGYRLRERLGWTALYGSSALVRSATRAVRRLISARLMGQPVFDPEFHTIITSPRWPVPEEHIDRPAWIDLRLPHLFIAFLDGDTDDRPWGHGPSLRIALNQRRDRHCVSFAIGLAEHKRDLERLLHHANEISPDSAERDWAVLWQLRLDGQNRGNTTATDGHQERARHGLQQRARRGHPPTVDRLDGGNPRQPSTGYGRPNDPDQYAHDSDATRPSVVPRTTAIEREATWHAADVGREDQSPIRSAAAIEREATWHAAYLFGAQQPDAYFGCRYPSQGSAYGFVHGLQGAPRDYAISLVPMCFVDPTGARDLLRLIMRMTKPNGLSHYAHTGRGQCTAGGVHSSPTDLPIFFLWAITEYVWSTGDTTVLGEREPFYPRARGLSATGAERIVLAFNALRDRVGQGPNGLLRVGSGDWADPISAMVRDRHAFHKHGESGFNTAFAVYALPRAAELIEAQAPEAAAAMHAFAGELRRAMESTWTGRWFLRGTDGIGGVIGRDHLFVDGQVWALIAKIGSDEQRRVLIDELRERCIDPSPIGATILDRPHPIRLGMLAPGWDCNGGVWAAINALLAWGLALHDPKLGWEVLDRQTLAAHAHAYPNVWYGIWSGPDAYNSWFGSHPGETFVQPATPMTEYPVMNSNAHAGPLLALLRVLGIETGPSGITVCPRGRPFRLDTALGRFERAT
ncbi:MAG: hypothetical protein N2037_05515 [Acidimicrobiales bacterium]|nr:hypothetical protein [Acidimicrobiales bacterium]